MAVVQGQKIRCPTCGFSLQGSVTLDGDGKRYSQVVERSFHISMAALETTGRKAEGKADSYISVMIQHDKAEFLLCTLRHGHLLQQPLDLNFTEGEEVTFFLNGKGVVHLTGYLVEENPPEELEYEGMTSSEEQESDEYSSEEGPPQLIRRAVIAKDDEESDEDEEATPAKAGKRKKKDSSTKKITKKAKVEQLIDSDEEDDDFDEDDLDSDDLKFIDSEAEEDSDVDDDDEEMNSEDEEELARMSGSFLQPKAKSKPQQKELSAKKQHSGKEMLSMSGKKQKNKATPSSQKQTPGGQKQHTDSEATPTTTPEHDRSDTSTEKKKKKKKKKKNKNKQGDGQTAAASNNQSQSKPSTPATGQKQTPGGATPASSQKSSRVQKRVLDGGIICEEAKEGHGPPAVPGKMVQVYYTGKLESGKIFDQAIGGKPFKFKLGKNEVIKGWDIGIRGMKVGGKRKLTVPARMAYGKEKVGNIPPNSTLVFDVELKAVS
ncbi:hypothetical protein LSH36_104g03074 [Paralvinella palmiformis]|uniref:FK506-binding protein n=1 Tax=Paralvinella palmiformis TaxID=53620 RepID=A0AAD9K1B9_9ANNE|nr:hypothetical protein LSH36_104g03074 [Paralvinella palmiformis]